MISLNSVRSKAKEEDNILDFSQKQKENKIAKTQYLTFNIGEELYGIKLMDNKEVIKLPRITSVPGTEKYVQGVINLRGQIVPVVDLKRKLKLSSDKKNTNEKNSRIIVVQINKMIVGIMVDKIKNVIGISEQEIEEINESKRGINQEFIEGVFSLADDLVVLINIKEILLEG